MRKITVIGMLWCILGFAQAQTILGPADYNPGGNRMGLHLRSELSINSNALANSFLWGFLNGRTVSTSEKDRMLQRASQQNRAGYDLNNGIVFSWRPKMGAENITFWTGLFDRQHLNAQYSKDMLEVLLYGNKRFAGREANFDDFSLNFFRYQQLEFGIARQASPRTRYGVGVSLLKGEQHVNMDADFMRLYTSPAGDQLRLNTLFTANQSDTTNQGFWAWNGWGVSTSGFWETSFQASSSNPVTFRFEWMDFGFLNWNDRSVRYEVDTLYSYVGTEIEDLFDLQDSLFEALTPDSILDELTTGAYNGSYSSYLPPSIQASLELNGKRWDGWLGVNQRFAANYRPYVFTRVQYHVAPSWKTGLLAGAGGYGTVNLGVNASFERDKWHVDVGTRNLEGALFFRRSGATNLFVQVNRYF